jgi:3-deoxy-D-manno-octulosonic-acid transferase
MGKKLYLPIFRQIEYFFVQDENSLSVLKTVGIEKAAIAGDTRVDRVVEIASGVKEYPEISDFIDESDVMVLGSVWPSDIKILYQFIQVKSKFMKFIIAPHNVGTNEIEELINNFDHTLRYSDLVTGSDYSESRILIIDNIGMLSSLYQYAKYAYVGGAFRGALHNLLEPAVYGIPVFYGQHASNQKFNEAILLGQSGGGIHFSEIEEMEAAFNKMQSDPLIYKEAASAAYHYIRSMQGATKKIMQYLNRFIAEE